MNKYSQNYNMAQKEVDPSVDFIITIGILILLFFVSLILQFLLT